MNRLRQSVAALQILRNFQNIKHNKQEVKKMIKYFRETGKTTYTVTNAVGNILQETLGNVDVIAVDEVQELYDKL